MTLLYKDNCEICKKIISFKNTNNEHFICELKTGFVVLSEIQFYKGYTLFICKKHATELHQLPSIFISQYLNEMALVAKAVWKTFKPSKLNYELLGNSEAHMHWHIIPRYKKDPKKNHPIWN